MATKVTDQPEVGFTGYVWHRPVVVNAGDGLHAATVTVAQTTAVHGFGKPHIGVAVLAQWNIFIRR